MAASAGIQVTVMVFALVFGGQYLLASALKAGRETFSRITPTKNLENFVSLVNSYGSYESKKADPGNLESLTGLPGTSTKPFELTEKSLPHLNKKGDDDMSTSHARDLEQGASFDIINSLPSSGSLGLRCYNEYVRHFSWLIDTILPGGVREHYDLQTIDPENVHGKYWCEFSWFEGHKLATRIVWADQSHQYLMPWFCVDCIFTVHYDGLYLYNLNDNNNVLIVPW